MTGRDRTKQQRVRCLLAGLSLAVCACAGPPGLYSTTSFADDRGPSGDARIERGRPSLLLDGLNHYVLSLPTKLLFLNTRFNDHRLPSESERVLRAYLDLNGLDRVLIRHNEYAPLEEWRRLRANTEVAAGYRYTLGVVTLLIYTLLPDRLFGGTLVIPTTGDAFNPFTNTVYVYTSDPAVLLHEGGHAKDYAEARYKGTWAALRAIPGVPLMQEYVASRDAVRFAHCAARPDLELDFYRTLIPAYGSYVGGTVGGVVPAGGILNAAGVVVGHIVGNVQAIVRGRALRRGDPEPALPSACSALGPPESAPTESVPAEEPD
jgi:hypothetical protein